MQPRHLEPAAPVAVAPLCVLLSKQGPCAVCARPRAAPAPEHALRDKNYISGVYGPRAPPRGSLVVRSQIL